MRLHAETAGGGAWGARWYTLDSKASSLSCPANRNWIMCMGDRACALRTQICIAFSETELGRLLGIRALFFLFVFINTHPTRSMLVHANIMFHSSEFAWLARFFCILCCNWIDFRLSVKSNSLRTDFVRVESRETSLFPVVVVINIWSLSQFNYDVRPTCCHELVEGRMCAYSQQNATCWMAARVWVCRSTFAFAQSDDDNGDDVDGGCENIMLSYVEHKHTRFIANPVRWSGTVFFLFEKCLRLQRNGFPIRNCELE